MKAVVMAGGEGSRLRPLTVDRPKPMVPVANAPVMEHILLLLRRHGIREVVATVQYLAAAVQDYFREGEDLGIQLQYSVEERPLGTAGSVKLAEEFLDEPFLVISGDALTNFDLTAVVNFHRESGACATLTLCRVPNPLEFGVVVTDQSGRIVQFQEKPSWGEVLGDTINTGIYVLNAELLEMVPRDQPFDFSNDLFPRLLRNKMPMYGYIAEGYWTDVGSVDEYRRANSDAVNGQAGVALPPSEGGVMLGLGTEVNPRARLFGNVLLGRDCQVRAGAVINGPTVIGDYTVIDENARIDQSVLWSNCYVGRNAQLTSCVVGRQTSIYEGARVAEAAVIGGECTVGRNSSIRSGVKIWPNKRIDEGAAVTTTLVYGSQARRTLFGRSGVTGLANIEMTPEFAAKVGAAFGSILKTGDRVVANRDPSRPARMIKRALMSGLTSTGVTVLDMGALPIGAARFRTGQPDVVAGVHVRISPYESNSVDIKLLDADGSNLPTKAERALESVMAREDFRRVSSDHIGEIAVIEVATAYSEALLGKIDAEALKRARPSIVVDYCGGAAAELLPAIFAACDCRHVEISGADQAGDLSEAMSRLSRITASVGADLGVRIDTDGRRIQVVDGSGRTIDTDKLTGAFLSSYARRHPGAKVCLPHHAPMSLARHLESRGAQIVWAGSTPQSIMLAARKALAGVGTDGTGAFCFTDFHIGFDALVSTLKLVEILASTDSSLAAAVASLPDIWQTEREVACPWEKRAAVMRALNDPARPRLPEFGDGLVYGGSADGKRIVVLPMTDRPAIIVYAEASDRMSADNLAAEWQDLLLTAQK